MAKRSLSRRILQQLAAIPSARVVVATVKTVTQSDAAAMRAFGLRSIDGALVALSPSVPRRDLGTYARRNVDGWKERRDDLPMEDRAIDFWAPNWHGSGSHLVSRTIKAYPIEHHPARLLTISTTILEQLEDGVIVRCRVDVPLDRSAPEFVEDLKFNLALLREIWGDAKVFDADMTDEEYANIQQVAWELLPRGSLDRMIARVMAGATAQPERAKVAEERLRALDRLQPDGFVIGTGKFSHYFGARFGERAVALENLSYGNALYLFEADWERLSQLSRTDLVRRRDERVHRVRHSAGWQSTLRSMIRAVRPS